jgi:N-acetylglucosamine-6-phosphate deacetylase
VLFISLPIIAAVKDGKIAGITNERPSESFDHMYSADTVCAGFIDIHNHGIGGADNVELFWTTDYTLERLPAHATTTVLASLTFPKNNQSTTDDVIACIEKKVGLAKPGQARIGGIHAEGPVIATCGGLPNSDLDISKENFERLLDSMPSLKIMTISPSLEQKRNYERIRALLERGVRPALGHDADASEASILGALKVATEYNSQLHITHMFNVSQFHHRNVSLCNFGMASRFPNKQGYEDLVPPSVEVIGDFVHLHPLTLQIVVDYKSNDTALITDAIMEAHEGKHAAYGTRDVEIKKKEGNHFVMLKGTETIAGSCSDLLSIFYNLVNVLTVPVERAVMMLSENPAKIAKLTDVGTLEEGKRADLVLFDSDLKLLKTLVDGKVAHEQ